MSAAEAGVEVEVEVLREWAWASRVRVTGAVEVVVLRGWTLRVGSGMRVRGDSGGEWRVVARAAVARRLRWGIIVVKRVVEVGRVHNFIIVESRDMHSMVPVMTAL